MNTPPKSEGRAPWRITDLLPYVLLVVLSLCTYQAVVSATYGFTDDYGFLHSTTSGNDDLNHLLITVGRPNQAGLIQVFFSAFPTIGSLKYVRLLGILGIGLFACCLYRHVIRLTGSIPFAIGTAFAISCLPAFQVYAAWSQYFSMPYACILAFFAYQAARKVVSETGIAKRIAFAAVSVALLLLSQTIHQVAGLFYPFFLASEFLHSDEDFKPALRRILIIMAIFMAALVGSFVLLKLGKHWFPASATNRDGLTHDLLGKAKWFFKHPLYDALSGPFIPASKRVAVPVLAAILLGFGIARQWPGISRLWKAAIAAAFVPFVYLPNLVVEENWSSYRTQAVLSALILYYLFVSLAAIVPIIRKNKTIHPSVAAMICATVCAAFGWRAGSNVRSYFAVPQEKEYQYVSKRLSRYDPAVNQGVYYISSSQWDSLAPRAMYDEFGLPSGSQPWVPKPFVRSVLHERGIPRSEEIAVEEIKPETVPPAKGFLLDFRGIGSSR